MDYIQNIRDFIKEKKIRSYTLAAYCEVTPNTINNWLMGKNPMPVPAYILLCEKLDLPYSYFFEEHPTLNKNKPEDISEISKLLKENNQLKDKIISLQDDLYQYSRGLLNKTG